MMSLEPEREPITRPVIVWLEVAAQLPFHGDGEQIPEIVREAGEEYHENTDPDRWHLRTAEGVQLAAAIYETQFLAGGAL